MSRKKSNVNIPLLAALVLLLLTMVSTHFTGGLLARYRSMSAGSDEARVAKFEVTASLTPNEGIVSSSESAIEINDGEGGTIEVYAEDYTLTVTNNSEVAVKYTVVLSTGPQQDQYGFPYVEIQLIDGNSHEVWTGDILDDVYLTWIPFKDQGQNQDVQFTLAPNSSVAHTLRFFVKAGDWSGVTYFANDASSYERKCDFTVEIKATQID